MLEKLKWNISSPSISLVPKMEAFLNEPYFLGDFGGEICPYISRIHTAYIAEYLHIRYLKRLVK